MQRDNGRRAGRGRPRFFATVSCLALAVLSPGCQGEPQPTAPNLAEPGILSRDTLRAELRSELAAFAAPSVAAELPQSPFAPAAPDPPVAKVAAPALAAVESIVPEPPLMALAESPSVEVHPPSDAKHPAPIRIAALDDAAPIAMAALVELTVEAPVLPHLPDPPATALALAEPKATESEREPLALTSPPRPEPASETAVLASASADPPLRDERVYIPQISDSARTAYIAQVTSGAAVQQLAVRVGDEIIGTVRFQIAEGHVSVHIGQVLDLFEGRMDSARFAALRRSPAAREFVPLETVRGAGIPLRYDPAYDELVLAATSG